MNREKSRQLLNNLKSENEALKQLLIETENQLEALRKESEEEVAKSKSLMKSIAPSLLGIFSSAPEEKFTQFTSQEDYNQAIIISEMIDRSLNRVSAEIKKIEKQNSILSSEILKTRRGTDRYLEDLERAKVLVQDKVEERDRLFRNLAGLKDKIQLYHVLTAQDASVSIFSILKP